MTGFPSLPRSLRVVRSFSSAKSLVTAKEFASSALAGSSGVMPYLAAERVQLGQRSSATSGLATWSASSPLALRFSASVIEER